MFHKLLVVPCFCFVVIVSLHAQINLSGFELPKKQVKEPVAVTIARKNPEADDSLQIILTLKMEKNVHIYSAESLFFRITIQSENGLEKGSIEYPGARPFKNFDGTEVNVYLNNQFFTINRRITAPEWFLKGTLQFQACDSLVCYTPRTLIIQAASDGTFSVTPDTGATVISEITTNSSDLWEILEKFEVKGSSGGFLPVEKFTTFLRNPSPDNVGRNTFFGNKGIVAIILLVLIGGIALNFTPCILPMIPITLAVLGAGSRSKSRSRGMLTGAIYGVAMAITYGMIGLVVILTGTQFGLINASPIFNIVLSVVFLVMAVAMFDVLQIDFTRFRKPGASGEPGKIAVVFVMGVVASLLAGACVAPVVIAVILYSGTLYANGNLAGLLLPFLLGTGMALPWPFAGAGLTLLPKPGKWMVWVKRVFGSFIFITALYYGFTGFKMLDIGLSGIKRDKTILKDSAPDAVHWVTDLQEGLRASQSTGKPLFVDFWATWCKNCKAMDATTLQNPEVKALLGNYVAVKYQAEKPDDQETKRVLDYFKIVGLPAYVILEPKEKDTMPRKETGIIY